jgi:Transposase DDE domain group 1
VEVTGDGEGLVSFAGAQLVLETSRATGLDDALRTALATWRRDRTRHDPGKVALDLAASIAIGGDCLASILHDLDHVPTV